MAVSPSGTAKVCTNFPLIIDNTLCRCLEVLGPRKFATRTIAAKTKNKVIRPKSRASVL